MSELIYQEGACVGSGAEQLFFSENVTEQRNAQEICMGCPARLSCLENALSENTEFGVWGGVIFWDGIAFLRRRSRGRPRKGESMPSVEADVSELWDLIKSA